jgi:hypothetical protein
MERRRVRRSVATRSYLHPRLGSVSVVASVAVSVLLNRHSVSSSPSPVFNHYHPRRSRSGIRPRLGELEVSSGGVDEDPGEAPERERVEDHVSQDEEGVAAPTTTAAPTAGTSDESARFDSQ